MNIAVVLFAGAEELDWAGPWEVFAAWRDGWPEDGLDVYTVGWSTEPVVCAKGLRVLPDYTWETAPAPDVVVWPGGRGTRRMLGDEKIREQVRSLAAQSRVMASVCTGALVYADAGLLDARRATTHWGSLDHLAELGAVVDADARFVDHGDVITAAGVSAGIDMALHLVATLHSRERAVEVRRYIQYDPEPPV